jgi:penicillin-binding protein 1A
MGRRDELARLVVEQHRRRRRRLERTRRRRRAGALAAAALLVFAALLALAGVGGGVVFARSCDLSTLQPTSIGQKSFVYAADGSLLGAIPSERNRERVTLRRMSPWVQRATIAIEDRRFYEHGGVDYAGIVRAAWRDVTAGAIVEGGSTIAQQLVRNLYTTGTEQTFERKLEEACLAIKLSDQWSKDKILGAYLNTVYFGNQAYGVEAASKTYFSKHARNLTIPEAALLAGLPQAPSVYEPVGNPKAAKARRNDVLHAMLRERFITPKQHRLALRAPLGLELGSRYRSIQQPFFFTYVIDELERVYGRQKVREGGLRVYTTIQPRLQDAARKAIRDTLYEPDDPAAAIVSIEPGTGAIRAMTAVIPGNARNQFNLAAQSRRQSGSTFKTFVLAAAIEQGADPDSVYYQSAPFTCTSGPWCEDDYAAGKPWEVSTYSGSYSGYMSLSSATLASDNTVYAQLTLDVGPDYVWRLATRLGIELSQSPVASIGLGPLGVSPLDMAAAYATFAAGGLYARPMAITKVVLPGGKLDTKVGWGKPQQKRALSEAVAWKVTEILAENASHGTGAGSGDGIHPAAGKTGTTEDHADAWYVGYTRQLSTAVWMGYPSAEIPMESVHGQTVAGSTFPVPIWNRYMTVAMWPKPALEFREPASYPNYVSWERGDFGYTSSTYDYSYDYDDDEEEEQEQEERTESTPAPEPATPSPSPAPAPSPAAPKPPPSSPPAVD